MKWHLGTMLESGALRWTTVSQERMRSFRRFDNWLTASFDDPTVILGDPTSAAEQAAAFARWTAVAANRVTRQSDTRHLGRTVPIRANQRRPASRRRAFAFIAANPGRGPQRSRAPSPGNESPTHTPPAGSARSPASRTTRTQRRGTTSTTTHSPRSPRALPLLGLSARPADD